MSNVRKIFGVNLFAIVTVAVIAASAVAQVAPGQVLGPPAPGAAPIGSIPGGVPFNNAPPGAPGFPNVADAMARVSVAQQAYAQAQNNLRQAPALIRKQYESAPAILHASAELDAAEKLVNDLRAAALKTLQSDQSYIQLQLDIDHVQGILDTLAHPDLADADRAALAQAKMEYAARLHNMEQDALNKNGDYTSALLRLSQAGDQLAALEATVDISVRSDPQLKQAQDDMSAAQSNLTAALAELDNLQMQNAAQYQYQQELNQYNANNMAYGFDNSGYPFYGRVPPWASGPAITSAPTVRPPGH